MSVRTCATDYQFMTTDQPATIEPEQGGFVGRPQGKASITIGQKMQGLYVGAGLRFVPFDGGELGSEHVLAGAVLLQGAPDIVCPVVITVIGPGAKTNDLDVVGKTGLVPVGIAVIDSGGVVEHYIL